MYKFKLFPPHMNDECFTKPKNSPPRAGKKGLQKVMKLLLAHTNNFHRDLYMCLYRIPYTICSYVGNNATHAIFCHTIDLNSVIVHLVQCSAILHFAVQYHSVQCTSMHCSVTHCSVVQYHTVAH